VQWIHLAQARDWWQALVNVVMNLQVLAPQSLLVCKLYMECCNSSSEFAKMTWSFAKRRVSNFKFPFMGMLLLAVDLHCIIISFIYVINNKEERLQPWWTP
jgi:hypothetical protein